MLRHLAYRNIRRNFRRSLITSLAIAMGVMVLILSNTLRTGQYAQMINSSVSQLAGHVVIQHPNFQEERKMEQLFPNRSTVQKQLQELYPDATITTRSFLGGLLTSTNGPAVASLTAIDPIAEAKVSEFTNKVIKGQWLDTDPRGIVIGVNTADTLGVDLGDKLVFTASINGEMNSYLYRVKGIFKTGSEEMDAFMAFVPIASADALFQQKDVSHQIAIHLTDVASSDQATAKMKDKVSVENAVILSWQEALPEVVNMIKVDQSSNEFINAILLFIVAMGILNTMLMSVLERIKEFGVLMAIGLRGTQMAKVVLWEGCILGLFGSSLGIVLGVMACYPLVTSGWDLSSAMGSESYSLEGAITSSVMYGIYNWTAMGIYFVMAVICSILAAAYPAWKLMQLQPVEAMRHQ